VYDTTVWIAAQKEVAWLAKEVDMVNSLEPDVFAIPGIRRALREAHMFALTRKQLTLDDFLGWYDKMNVGFSGLRNVPVKIQDPTFHLPDHIPPPVTQRRAEIVINLYNHAPEDILDVPQLYHALWWHQLVRDGNKRLGMITAISYCARYDLPQPCVSCVEDLKAALFHKDLYRIAELFWE
jgi:hypothetical protein